MKLSKEQINKIEDIIYLWNRAMINTERKDGLEKDRIKRDILDSLERAKKELSELE